MVYEILKKATEHGGFFLRIAHFAGNIAGIQDLIPTHGGVLPVLCGKGIAGSNTHQNQNGDHNAHTGPAFPEF